VREKLEVSRPNIRQSGMCAGLGLFFAVEIVKNRKTKQPFNTMLDKVKASPWSSIRSPPK